MKRLKHLAAVVLFTAVSAGQAAPVSSADIVFIVDESGSMFGEHAFLQDIVDDLDTGLAGAGVSTRNYGVIGYGGVRGNSGTMPIAGPRDVVAASSADSELTDLATAQGALAILTPSGNFEDGWQAIDFGLGYTFSGDSVNFILVTDEDRDDNTDGGLTEAGILAGLVAQGVKLNVVTDVSIEDDDGNTALGTDFTDAFTADGLGGFDTTAFAPGGSFTDGGGCDGSPSCIDAYVDLARETGGAAWDLNQLRAGDEVNLLAESFAAAFLDVKIREIATSPPSVPEPGVLGLVSIGLAGLGAARVWRRASAAR